MYAIHKTSDGRTMFISEMEDSHLLNTINYILREIDSIKKAYLLKQDPNLVFYKLLSTRSRCLSEEALGERLSYRIEALYPYVLEASLRGLNISSNLQETFKRTSKEEGFSGMLLEQEEEEEDDEEIDARYS